MIKLLIADDEEKTRSLTKLMIDKQLGISVVGEAANGEEGMAVLKDKCPDILITDIKMPCMDGLVFAEKALAYNADLIVMIMSAYEDFEYAHQAIRLGVADYLLKPIKKSELNEALSKAIAHIKEMKVWYGIEQEKEETDSLAAQVISYIMKHLDDAELSLTSAAKNFFVNPSYLSRVFKNDVGESFIEYLTRVRMEKAVWYLENTDKKAYEIAELVGISDAAYFGKCFKKYKGVSIYQYKKLVKEYS